MRSQFGTRVVNLDHVLHAFRKISEAPGLSDLYAQGIRIDDERENRYKGRDSAGNVYLLMNPAVWPEKVIDGMTFRIRPKPKLMLGASKALDEAKEKPLLDVPAAEGAEVAQPEQRKLNYGFA